MACLHFSAYNGLREHTHTAADLDGPLDDFVRADLQDRLVSDAVRAQALFDQGASR